MHSANIAFRPLRGNAIAAVVLMGVALLPLPAGAEGALAVSFPKKPGEWSIGWAMNWVSPGAIAASMSAFGGKADITMIGRQPR
jgi:hypothetical protein